MPTNDDDDDKKPKPAVVPGGRSNRPAKATKVERGWDARAWAEKTIDELVETAKEPNGRAAAVAALAKIYMKHGPDPLKGVQSVVDTPATLDVAEQFLLFREAAREHFVDQMHKTNNLAHRMAGLEVAMGKLLAFLKFDDDPDGLVDPVDPIEPDDQSGSQATVPDEAPKQGQAEFEFGSSIRGFKAGDKTRILTPEAAELSLVRDHTMPERKGLAASPKVHLGNAHPELNGLSRKENEMNQAVRAILYDLCVERGELVAISHIKAEALRRKLVLETRGESWLRNALGNFALRYGDNGYWDYRLKVPENTQHRKYTVWLPRQQQDCIPAEKRAKEHNAFLASVGHPEIWFKYRSPGRERKGKGSKLISPVASTTSMKIEAVPPEVTKPAPKEQAKQKPQVRRPTRGVKDQGKD